MIPKNGPKIARYVLHVQMVDFVPTYTELFNTTGTTITPTNPTTELIRLTNTENKFINNKTLVNIKSNNGIYLQTNVYTITTNQIDIGFPDDILETTKFIIDIEIINI